MEKWQRAVARNSVRVVEDLKRGLNARHTAFIAISSGVGTGLFLGSATALSNAGPLGLLLGYAFMSLITWIIALISAETAGFLPVSGGFIRHVPMFTNTALGTTCGYVFTYLLAITAPAEVTAATSLISFWRPDLSPAIFITVFGLLIVLVNLGPVRLFGESEFFFGAIKSIAIIGLIIAGLVVDVGGNPAKDYIGGRNWAIPMREYLVSGGTGRFLGFWSTLTNAAFALGNIQIATSAASEVQNPRVNVPKAMRRVFWRLFFFYIMSLLMVGLILPADDPRIGTASGTAGSPFVLAFSSVGIKVLPSIINAVVITSAFSSGNGVLFLASRTLLGLSAQNKAPKIFLRTNRFGCPYVAVGFCSLLMPLAYLVLGNSTSNQVFNWLVNIIAVSGLMMWCAICVGYLRFYYGLRARGISRDELPYKSPFQPYAAWFAGIVCFLVVFFSGFSVFFPGNFSAANFLSNYISVFIFIAIYIVTSCISGWKFKSYDEMDFSEMDAIREERAWNEANPKLKMSWYRSLIEKVTDE
ncbi:amino acid permease/ SLC12A domain-containing protein [Leucosporidium creatinivorum]|uniref:Amino acid permease/ SLC12A domain-containing protein n=1 Tax=Leucosporidium creatinivorum TaxID=106004 RepID=A0A1Y2FY38_9BASI|nr:amino acid permease/ SLC12A domain-containing protein [Leucosporidium creatinivorum]